MDDEADKAGRPHRDEAGETAAATVDEHLAAQAEEAAAREAEAEAGAASEVSPPVPSELMEDLREVRVAAAAAIGPADSPAAPSSRGPSAVVLAASLFLVGSALLSMSFMLTHGGLSIDLPTPGPSGVAAASPSAPPSAEPSPSPTAVTPSPTVQPTTRPTPSPTPNPLLALLEPCPDKPNCYLYTVKTNDRLAKIATKFGVPLDRILELNPWITDQNIIHPGDKITLPPPGP